MTLKKITKWLQLIGNLGLLAGLGLVAVQIQQGNNLARAQFRAEASKTYADMEIAMLGENPTTAWVKSVFDPASMTREEIRIMDGYLVQELGIIRRTMIREQAGLEAPGTFAARVQDTAYFFGNEFAQTWWKYEQVHQTQNPELVRLMNEAIASHEKDHTAKWVMRIEQDIRKLPPVTLESAGLSGQEN